MGRQDCTAIKAALQVIDWGLLSYEEALQHQRELVARRLSGGNDWLILVEHPPTVTLGRRGGDRDLLVAKDLLAARGIALCRVERGGHATAHEPGQLVVYPVVQLEERDLHRYVGSLLETAADVLRSYGLAPELKPGEPGLWVGGAKIASIGVAVKRWVTYHGLALNVANDLTTFDSIVPCGKRGERVTSMSRELGSVPDLAEVKKKFRIHFRRRFGYPEEQPRRHPQWLKIPAPAGEAAARVEKLVSGLDLGTVCQSAQCPNLGECFGRGTATFMLLGTACTRRCRFCAVDKGSPLPVDADEPRRVALAARQLGLEYVVLTSVTRDDLPDGGAGQFAETVREIRKVLPETKIEVLVPDFKGDPESLDRVLRARPDVFNHNIETVARLYRSVRPQADYNRSLQVLRRASRAGIPVKSGLMLGLGEGDDELKEALKDLREAGCVYLTLGQYLAPSRHHLEVVRHLPPEEFGRWKNVALDLGFKGVASGPLVRSSYRADRLYSMHRTGDDTPATDVLD